MLNGNFSQPSRGRSAARMAMGLVLAVAGAMAAPAWAEGFGGRGGEFGEFGMFKGRPGHANRAIDHVLDSVNATDAQRAQIKQIVQAAATDLKAQRAANRGLREQGLQLFSAPVVDARAVEALRQQRLAQHDLASKRVTQAMLDISNVLTPDQRAKLAERIKQRAQRMQERMQKRQGAASAPQR